MRRIKTHPYDQAAAQALVRQFRPIGDAWIGESVEIERGVNFFVLALEALGAQTRASCEGHPTGFYIVFDAPYELVLNLAAAGYFTYEANMHRNVWALRWEHGEQSALDRGGEPLKQDALRFIAHVWMLHFGERLAALAGEGACAKSSP